MASVPTSPEVDAIRRQMAQIRRELHEDMQGVVVGAEEATQWRYYYRQYPWAALAAAFVLGYLIVPSKTRHRDDDVEPARPRRKGRDVVPESKADKQEKRAGLVGTLFGMLSPIVMRAGQSYASNFVENWIAQQGILGPEPQPQPQPQPQAQPSQPKRSPGGPARPGGPGMPGGAGPRRP